MLSSFYILKKLLNSKNVCFIFHHCYNISEEEKKNQISSINILYFKLYFQFIKKNILALQYKILCKNDTKKEGFKEFSILKLLSSP